MKKSCKLVVGLLVIVMAVSALALTACSNEKFEVKYAYGYQAFGEGYISIARVEVDKNGKLVSARLDESCFPNIVELSEKDIADNNLTESDYGLFTTGAGTGSTSDINVYAKVRVGSIVFTLDSATKAYKIDGKTLAEYFSGDNRTNEREAFALAVANNEIYVTIGGVEKEGVITKADLLKSQNGYWTNVPYGKGWGTNTFAVCNYVMVYGFGATSFTNAAPGTAQSNYFDNNGIDTGASCTDFEDYFNLLKKAYES